MVEWIIGWLIVVGMLMDDEKEHPRAYSEWTMVGYCLLMLILWPIMIGIYLNEFRHKDKQE